MSENHSLVAFISDIDKIVAGDLINPSDYEHCDEEYKELLFLAQLLAKADYTPEGQDGIEKIVSKTQEDDELEDDELDMVAGGVNLNEILEEDKKKE